MSAIEVGTTPDRATVVGRPAKCRSATTNQPLRGRVSQRTAAGRRIADLYRAFLERMGPTDAISQAAALNAAELTVALEQARLAAARGESVDVDQLVRLSNLVARAEKKLNLNRRRVRASDPSAFGGLTLPPREREP